MTARPLWAGGVIAAQHVSEHDLGPLGRDAGLPRLDPRREPGGVAVALGFEREVLRPEGDKPPPGLRPNPQLQAARVSDTTAFLLLGELVEHAPTQQLFTTPGDERTEQYVTGKFG